MLKLLFKALTLDIYDLCYSNSSEFLAITDYQPIVTSPARLLKMMATFPWRFAKAIRYCRSSGPKPNHGAVVFLGISINHIDCLQPIADKIPNAYAAMANPYGIQALNRHPQFPLILAYLMATPFFPWVLWKWMTARGYRRRSFYTSFHVYWLSYGFYLAAYLWLRDMRASALVIANDHNMYTRAAAMAAHDQGTPTYYIQHACVTQGFPPLCFTYAMLDGRDALQKYRVAGPSDSKVFLLGMTKLDPYANQINHNTVIRSIGVAINRHDLIPRVDSLCSAITEQFPGIQLVIRPHPGEGNTTSWQALTNRYKARFSNSAEEDPFQFISKIDVVIAGDSSILLEAALLDVLPVYYDFSGKHHDWYGFEKNGLVDYFNNPQDACDMLAGILNNKPSVREKAKFYCATVGTTYEGKSSQLAATVIQQACSPAGVDYSTWQPISDAEPLQAYEPANT